MMKIGASTLATLNDSLEDSLEFIDGLGIGYVELLHQYPNEEISTDVLSVFDLDYTIHAPFMDVNIAALGRSSRENSLSQIMGSIDLANRIDAKAVVVHPGLIPFLARDYPEKIYNVCEESARKISEYSHDFGVNTTIENMPNFESMIFQDVSLLNDLVVSADLGMTLDIGHANHCKISPEDMYFDSIKHIHIHDNLGDDDSHLALGEGSINLNHIIDIFQRNNYDGIYMIEVNNKDSIRKSFEYLKNKK